MCLCFRKDNLTLHGFSDADLGRDFDTKKSTTSYIFILGGTAVSWKSKLHHRVFLSTTEAEYIATSKAEKEEDLMVETFGQSYTEYASKVKYKLIPFIY